MARYTVHISITEAKLKGPQAAFCILTPELMLDANFATDDITAIRSMVDGLIVEGVPATRPMPVAHPTPTIGAGYRVPDSRSDIRGPLMGDGSEVRAEELYEVGRPGSWLPGGGKHSGDCSCSACAEPDAPDDTPRPYDTTAS